MSIIVCFSYPSVAAKAKLSYMGELDVWGTLIVRKNCNKELERRDLVVGRCGVVSHQLTLALFFVPFSSSFFPALFPFFSSFFATFSYFIYTTTSLVREPSSVLLDPRAQQNVLKSGIQKTLKERNLLKETCSSLFNVCSFQKLGL